jgi:hypothetical protein
VGLAVLAVAAALAPGFHASVQPIPAAMRAEMTGVSDDQHFSYNGR